MILIDIADMSKHNRLDNPKRENTLTVSSMFECNRENQFRFLRNIIDIHHTNSTVHTIMTKDLNGKIQIITIDYKENENLVKNNERF